MQKLLALFCVLASLLPAAPALAAMPDAEFLKLCEQGSPAAVAQALKDGANPNAADVSGYPALAHALMRETPDKAELVKMLLDAGANPGAAAAGNSAISLYIAALQNETESVRLLLKAGADVNARGGDREVTALHGVAIHGKPEMLRLLLDAGANPNLAGKSGTTPLALAVVAGNVENARLLLEAGADVNASSKGRTALMAAVRENDAQKAAALVRLLLAAGADINATDQGGRTALMLAAREAQPELIQTLLEAGAHPKAQDKQGKTALDWALEGGNGKALAPLIQRTGVPVNPGKVLSETAAVGNEDIIKALLAAHVAADATAAGELWTPLVTAAFHCQIESIRLLLAAGANPNATSIAGRTALMEAASHCRAEAVKLLLEAGANPNAMGDVGDSALTCAAQRGDLESFRLLLDAGADPSAALMYAAQRDDPESVRLLLAHGADANHQGRHGKTALDWALEKGRTEAAALLRAHQAK